MQEAFYQQRQENASEINMRHEEARDIILRILAKPRNIELVAKLDALDESDSVFEGKHYSALQFHDPTP